MSLPETSKDNSTVVYALLEIRNDICRLTTMSGDRHPSRPREDYYYYPCQTHQTPYPLGVTRGSIKNGLWLRVRSTKTNSIPDDNVTVIVFEDHNDYHRIASTVYVFREPTASTWVVKTILMAVNYTNENIQIISNQSADKYTIYQIPSGHSRAILEGHVIGTPNTSSQIVPILTPAFNADNSPAAFEYPYFSSIGQINHISCNSTMNRNNLPLPFGRAAVRNRKTFSTSYGKGSQTMDSPDNPSNSIIGQFSYTVEPDDMTQDRLNFYTRASFDMEVNFEIAGTFSLEWTPYSLKDTVDP